MTDLDRRVDELSERLKPTLLISGGDGPDYEKLELLIPAGERFGLIQKYEYPVRGSPIKVLQITNLSEVAVSGAQAAITKTSDPSALDRLPLMLSWFHNDEEKCDLGPGMFANAVRSQTDHWREETARRRLGRHA